MAIDWANRPVTADRRAMKPRSTVGGRRRSDVDPQPGPTALGAMLRDRGLVTDDQLSAAIARQKKTGQRLGHILVELGFVSPDAVLEALSQQLGVATVRINAHTVHPDAVTALPEKVARRHTAFPLQKVGTTLIVALASPEDLNALDDIRFASGCDVQTVLALEEEILSALNRYYCDEWLPETSAAVLEAVVLGTPPPQGPVSDQAAERSAVSVL
jgi:type IV pilus assembly protein PilB